MSKILFFGGVILIIAWSVGFFGFHVSGAFHLLLAIAIIALTIRLFYNKSLMS
jgi:hypothetical protein